MAVAVLLVLGVISLLECQNITNLTYNLIEACNYFNGRYFIVFNNNKKIKIKKIEALRIK